MEFLSSQNFQSNCQVLAILHARHASMTTTRMKNNLAMKQMLDIERLDWTFYTDKEKKRTE